MFRLKLSVCHLCGADAVDVLSSFISLMREKYALQLCDVPVGVGEGAEAVIAIPFADRESIRIDFNIFAAQFEADYSGEPMPYFKLESI